MKSSPTVSLLATLITALATPVLATENLVTFDGAVGVHPVAGITVVNVPVNGVATNINAVVRNDVRGIPPGGRPWLIRTFKASVKNDGRIAARGQGLILGGNNTIGTSGGVATVAATLFCGSDAGFSSAAFPLAANGDFEIKDVLSPLPPAPCGSAATPPVLLIGPPLNNTPGVPTPLRAWFAAGIPEMDGE